MKLICSAILKIDNFPVTPQIVGHVCKFLTISDIKQCRLVSNAWNYGSTPRLKAKTRTRLSLCRNDTSILEVIDKLKFSPVNVLLQVIADPSLNLPPVDISIFPMMRNVKSINVTYKPGDELKFPGNLGNKIIHAASPTLKKLEFDGHSFPRLAGTIFPKLLSLNRLVLHVISETTRGLECLLEIPGSLRELNFSVNFQVDDRLEGKAQLDWKFPTFPKLKKIKIMGDMVTGLLGFETMPSYFGPIEYNVCFPVVEILEIWSCSDAFIPLQNQIQVVESVKRIDLEGMRWNNVAHYAEMYIRMFDIFPNAKESVRKILDDLLQHSIRFGRCRKMYHM
ncbi:hypothetical protein Fcan01_26574 [Folsomia candida]|uniref:F-box domain-containing protein n=1 Tax=Folsomia candida TaxID=158441 RepID=A0A226D0K6_FOLCA|nr:hypothetical protein Fcan01_26574 [Folsomia candida]